MKRPLAAGLACYLTIIFIGAKCGAAAAALGAVAAALSCYFAKKLGRERFAVLMLCLFAAASVIYYDAAVLRPVARMDGQEVTVTGRVTEVSDYYGDIHIAAVKAVRPRTNVSVFFEGEALTPGDTVTASGVAASTLASAERGWLRTWYKSQNNLLQMKDAEILSVEHGGAPLSEKIAVWRERAQSLLPEGLPRALMFGDRDALSEADVNAFERTGLIHMLSFSGTHFMVLTLALSSLLSFMGLDKRKSAGVTLVFIAAVIVFMGFRVSIVRSGLMAVILSLGTLLRRKSDPLTSLLLAVFLICAPAPYAIESTSLLLSFSAVAGIILLSKPLTIPVKIKPTNFISKIAARTLLAIFGAGAVTLSATLGSAAVTLLTFGSLPMLALPANLLTFAPMSGILLLGPFAGGFVGRALEAYCLFVIRGLAALPGTVVYKRSAAVWVVLGAWGAIYLLALLYQKRASKPAALLTGGAILLFAVLMGAAAPNDQLNIAMVDVGQGLAVILSDGGTTYVYDCGSSSAPDPGDRVAYQLGAMGVTRVDALILSHADYDHISGVEELLSQVEVDKVLVGDLSDYEELTAAFPEADFREVGGVMTLSAGETTVTLTTEFWAGGSSNDRCVVLSARRGESSLLLTGDLTAAAELLLLASGFDTDADVLQLAHHGSASSSSSIFLGVADPAVCLVPVGKNSYGHPTGEALSRAGQVAEYILRSDEVGTVELTTAGDGVFTVYCERG
ncbi:MAG TPA: ComEC/Rec2 family competence protein [Candidatus Acidoferrum sp.]|nr:ComEC/Rec2 family competence protein [Candidatus Acidoferrum sp.]